MNRFAVLCCAVALAACMKSEQEADKPGATVTPASLTLADLAGTWTVRAMPETGDTTLTTYTMVATADTTGWTMTLPDRPTIPLRVVALGGDSVVTHAGPFESVLRKGVTVSTHSVSRLRDGKFVGTFVARYVTAGPDSVMRGRHEGTRTP